VEVDRPSSIETTALGAAFLAGLGVGVFSDLDDVRRAYRVDKTFEVLLRTDEREQRLASWREAVARARNQAVTR
jgi:glycerol kinase